MSRSFGGVTSYQGHELCGVVSRSSGVCRVLLVGIGHLPVIQGEYMYVCWYND